MTLELFLQIGAFVALLVTGAWALLSLSGQQLDQRLEEKFAAMERARRDASELWREMFAGLKAEWQLNFDKLLEDRKEEEKEWHRVERELNALRVELPREYVRREDHIRFETVINAKLDSVASKLDLANERNRKD